MNRPDPKHIIPPAGAALPAPHPLEELQDAEEGGKKKKKKKGKDRLDSTRGIETMFRTSYRTHVDMSALADNKANIMISINGLMASILLASIASKIDSNSWLLIPTTILLSGCVISMVFAVLAARPRLASKVIDLNDVRQNAANILFFGNFTKLPESDYVDAMTTLLRDSPRLYQMMIRDIYSLGGVLERKFRLLRTSYTVFMVGLVAGALAFVIVFLLVVLVGPPAPPVQTF
jgi:hypothetical protein